MTEKLYYKDAYIREFSALVLSCSKLEFGYDILLDKTAFFPEEGGQYSDTGTINGIRVTQVKEKDGIIHHVSEGAVPVGVTVKCEIDFDERYEKMQCHTGEHILSGIIHRRFGLDNVGFHLGKEDVTMDVSRPLTREELMLVEKEANEIIYKNVEVTAEFPSPEELVRLEYRSKLDLTENVRIVRVGEYDACACCAPHVKHTGEIGLIKILDFAKLRGGIRIHIAAGRRAMRIFSEYYDSISSVSSLLSVPKAEISDGVEKLLSDINKVKTEFSEYRLSIIEKEAEKLTPTSENAVVLLPGATVEELIAYSNLAIAKVAGILVLLCGEECAYKYVISSNSRDLRALAQDINKSLLGRGGGRPNMIQGNFQTGIADIKRYFSLQD